MLGCEVALLQVFGRVCGAFLWVVDLCVWFVGCGFDLRVWRIVVVFIVCWLWLCVFRFGHFVMFDCMVSMCLLRILFSCVLIVLAFGCVFVWWWDCLLVLNLVFVCC